MTKYLIEQNNECYSVKNNYYRLGSPEDLNQLSNWYIKYGSSNISELSITQDFKEMPMIKKSEVNNIWETEFEIDTNDIDDNIELIVDRYNRVIKYKCEPYKIYDKIDEKFNLRKLIEPYKEYGVEWYRNSDTVNRLGDAMGLTAITGGQNDFSNLYPWNSMKRCNLSDDGEVLAYYGDSNYKTDGSNGQVMVEIPKFWYKVVNDEVNNKIQFWICDSELEGYELHPAFYRERTKLCDDLTGKAIKVDKRYVGVYLGCIEDDKLCSKSGVSPKASVTMSEGRDYAKARGNGWGIEDYNLFYAIQLLYLVEYADFDSQSKIGRGYVSMSSSSKTKTGGTDSLGNESGSENNNGESGKNQVSYRGIEDIWGNYYYWIDGFYCDNNRNILIGNSGFNDSGTKYEYIYRTVLNSNIGNYIVDIFGDKRVGFVIKTSGDNSNYKIPDYAYIANNKIPYAGGSSWAGNEAGIFSFRCSNAFSDKGNEIVARCSF